MPQPEPARPLQGRAVLVTRPAAMAQRLCALIEAAGGEALRFPTLEILPPGDPDQAARLLAPASLAGRDLVIFISPSAVASAFASIQGAWHAELAVAAVGQGTARALAARGLRDVLVPAQGGDSEALAALPRMQQIAGQRVLIVRGEGGRGWLAETLRGRGAQVEYAECYRRGLPKPAPELIQSIRERWRQGGVDAVSVTSRQALDNLIQLFADDLTLVRATPLFAAHARIAEYARRQGMAEVVACEPGDQAMLAALSDFFHSQGKAQQFKKFTWSHARKKHMKRKVFY